MNHYRKLIAAAVGCAVFYVHDKTGIDMTPMTENIVGLIIAVLTSIGVWAVPNEVKS